jgi:hypothetical protein
MESRYQRLFDSSKSAVSVAYDCPAVTPSQQFEVWIEIVVSGVGRIVKVPRMDSEVPMFGSFFFFNALVNHVSQTETPCGWHLINGNSYAIALI